jgi:hypothetical protein
VVYRRGQISDICAVLASWDQEIHCSIHRCRQGKTAGRLGASFFFSRDEAECSNAQKFFTTIAFQLCVYDKKFSQAIESVLRDERGIAATAQDSHVQLEELILEPLRDIVRLRPQPVLVVVDALDECEDQDAVEVLAGLRR